MKKNDSHFKRLKYLFEYKVSETEKFSDDALPDFEISDIIDEDEDVQAKPNPAAVAPVAKKAPLPQAEKKPVPAAPVASKPAPVAPKEVLPPTEDAPAAPEGKIGDVSNILSMQVNKMEEFQNSVNSINQKIDTLANIFSKFTDITAKLQKDVEEVKEPSPVEKLEMRSLDSYPFNLNLNTYWNDEAKNNPKFNIKGVEQTPTGELKANIADMQSYSKDDIKKSFNV